MTKEEIKEYNRAYYIANKEKLNKQCIDYYNTNKENINQYRKDNEKLSEYRKDYYQNNKEKFIVDKEQRNQRLKEQRKLNKLNNPKKVKTPEQLAEYRKQYYLANKEKFKGDNLKRNQRNKERKATEPLFKLKTNIRQLIRISIQKKGYRKSTKTENILGCTIEQFKQHIESQFEDWMTWENYGNPKDNIYELNKTWDIDHIIPINKALTEEEVIKLNHYTNLKPLCSYVNRFIKRAN